MNHHIFVITLTFCLKLLINQYVIFICSGAILLRFQCEKSKLRIRVAEPDSLASKARFPLYLCFCYKRSYHWFDYFENQYEFTY